MKKHRSAVVIAGLFLAACNAAEQPAQKTAEKASGESALPEVVIRTKDYSFDAPDTIVSGASNVRLINDGPDLHHIQLIRLEQGKTADDLTKAMQAGPGPLPAWAVDVGGPNTPGRPGGENSAIMDLEPGNYVMLCFIPAPADGQPHVMKGMIKPLTVVAAEKPSHIPAADLVMTLDDYTFETNMPITAGKHTIRIENGAQQSHEVVIAKLAPGKTPMDLMKFVEKPEGTPPGEIVGGVTGIARGEVNQVTYEFTPGDYALICFVPDAKDGKPHVAHGMVKQFKVD